MLISFPASPQGSACCLSDGGDGGSDGDVLPPAEAAKQELKSAAMPAPWSSGRIHTAGRATCRPLENRSLADPAHTSLSSRLPAPGSQNPPLMLTGLEAAGNYK